MGIDFGRLAVGTSCDVLSEKGGHSRPPIVPLYAMEGSEEPFVTSGGGFMEGFYQFVACGLGDVESVFEV